MQATAKRSYVRISPRKMRIVADVVRGKKVQEAVGVLQFMPHKAARFIEKTILSAAANLRDQNAEERIDDEALVVKTIMVDAAPMISRFRPVSRGRAHSIKKRNSHLTVIVGLPADVAAEA